LRVHETELNGGDIRENSNRSGIGGKETVLKKTLSKAIRKNARSTNIHLLPSPAKSLSLERKEKKRRGGRGRQRGECSFVIGASSHE